MGYNHMNSDYFYPVKPAVLSDLQHEANHDDHHHHHVQGIKHQHSHVKLPTIDIFPPTPPPVLPPMKPMKPYKPRRKKHKKPIMYKEKPLPYMPGYKWNNYTNKKEK